MFDAPEYTYRVFVTNMKRALDLVVWFTIIGPGRLMDRLRAITSEGLRFRPVMALLE